MKKIKSLSWAMLILAFCSLLGACGDYTPNGYEEVAALPGATDVKASVSERVVTVTWTPPVAEGLTGLALTVDADWNDRIELPATATSYQFIGQPMGVDVVYTVKAIYGDRTSAGTSTVAMVPQEELAEVSDLKVTVNKRTVTMDWKLPAGESANITGIRVTRNGELMSNLPADATGIVLKGQPMEDNLTYTVQPVYYNFYPSKGASKTVSIEYVKPLVGFLLMAASPADLPDDDEQAAASWFKTNYVDTENGRFISAAQLEGLDPVEFPVLWIMVDRNNLERGWQNLPSEVSSQASIDNLRAYTLEGGSLYLSNMATQLTVPLDFVPDDMAPTVYANGEGGVGEDVWCINPKLGWDFRDGGSQGYYDRSAHAIYDGIEMEDPNEYGYTCIPLIGPGRREDHNCMWDCNLYGRGEQKDVIKNFEILTFSLVLATWGQVRDHCVAGLVEFYGNENHGRCIANGLAAYEWNQNTGENIYQHNINKLTSNILEYLK